MNPDPAGVGRHKVRSVASAHPEETHLLFGSQCGHPSLTHRPPLRPTLSRRPRPPCACLHLVAFSSFSGLSSLPAPSSAAQPFLPPAVQEPLPSLRPGNERAGHSDSCAMPAGWLVRWGGSSHTICDHRNTARKRLGSHTFSTHHNHCSKKKSRHS